MPFAPLTFLVALIFLAGAPAPAAEPAGEPLKLKAAHIADESFAWHKGLERFRDVARAKSQNTLEVQIYPSGMLGSERDYVQYLLQGVLDVAPVAPTAAGALAREVAFLELPCLWKDQDHWQRSLDAEVGRQLAEVLERATTKGNNPGFRVLGYWGGSELHLAARSRGFQAVKELASIRLRVQDSAVQQEMWKVLGVEPVILPMASTITALQKGNVIEGVDGTFVSLLAMKAPDLAPHVTLTGHAASIRPLFMSGHTWKKLSAVQQRAILDAAREATVLARSLEAQQSQEAEAQLKTRPNVQFHPFREKPLMREQTQGIRQRVAAELGLAALLDAIDVAWTEKGGKKK